MPKLSCIALAVLMGLALGGCSSAGSAPVGASGAGDPAPHHIKPSQAPPSSGASQAEYSPPPSPAAAAAPEMAMTPSAVPVEGGEQSPVPPTLAPLGPIPGPRVQGENPGTTIQNPYANDPSALEQGRQLFVQMNCAGCHGGHAGGGMGPNLRSPKEWKFGDTPAEIFDSISQGRGDGMPAWGTKLPPDVIWKLVAYIQSLGTPEEPNKAAPAPAHAPNSAAAQVW